MEYLSAEGRKALNNFIVEFHKQAGVMPGEQFALTPNQLQTLHKKIVLDGSPFLRQINVRGVTQITGQKLFMAINKLASSRTDTTVQGKEREPRSMRGMSDSEYRLYPTESDIGIPYADIDEWAAFPEFATMYMQLFRNAIANDRVRVGFHGITAEATTDPVTNPNGEDLNIGWLQQARLHDAVVGAGSHVMSGVTIGAGGDFANLDALVAEAKNDLIAPEFKNSPGMKSFLGADIVGNAEGKFYTAAGDKPSEKTHMDDGRILQTYGGLRAESPAFFPDGTLALTYPKNLSLYYQKESWRRTLKDKPEKNEYQDFNSRNEGYVLEQPTAFALVENITFL